ncbi:uncharacterized protein LOC124930064 [Impatiens glandulifera]|uniref:uncharacterized protein LOC124930064 n=1 Tax=Impatiens glandulifera TaxID=253017 RepID=UPI001FB08CDE|nr:uncharacterized protein LOC124930064 [Impatiens glandulifera]
MELIKNKKSRQISFKRMKANLMKKASELHTLCDVDVSIITIPPNTDGEDEEQLQSEIWPAAGSDKFLSQIEEFKKQSHEEKMKRTIEVDSYLEERCKKLEDEIIKQRKKNYDAVYPSWNHPYYNDLPEEKLVQIASDLEYKLHQSTNVFKLGSQQPDYHHHHPSEFIPNMTSNFHDNIVDNQYLLLDQQQPDNLFDNLIYDYDYYASTIPSDLMNIDRDDRFRTIDINNNMIHMLQNDYEEQRIRYYSGMMQNNNNTMQYQSLMDTTGSTMHYQYVPSSLSSSSSSSSSSIFNSGYSDTCGESQLLHPPPPPLLTQNHMDVNWNQYYCA